MNLFKQIRWGYILAIFKMRRMANSILGVRQLDYAKKKLLIRTTTIREYETRARSVEKEPETVAWIEDIAVKGGTLYDIGANVGAYSLIAAANGMKVVAFEPAPENWTALHENMSLNDLTSRITALPFVLSDTSRIGTFLASPDRGSTATFVGGSSEGDLRLPVITLDSCVALFGLPPPTAMKIDVDGAEKEVLLGAQAALKAPQLRSILVEVEASTESDVQKVLTSFGFSLVSVHARHRESVKNLIFTRL